MCCCFRHGNYTGPGYSVGTSTSNLETLQQYNSLLLTVPPVDQADMISRIHDIDLTLASISKSRSDARSAHGKAIRRFWRAGNWCYAFFLCFAWPCGMNNGLGHIQTTPASIAETKRIVSALDLVYEKLVF